MFYFPANLHLNIFLINAVSFDEDVYFEHPESAKAVTISMRKAVHDYFGINEVSVIGGGEPLIMLISGITSPTGDMCLQASLI